jgi:hypothetical protein
VPIVDASWNYDNEHHWILFERVSDDNLIVKSDDACKFIAKLLPIMFERRVYFTDINIDNLCYYSVRSEVKILDCEFSFDRADTYIYPFAHTEFRTTLLENLSRHDLIYMFAVIMMKMWRLELEYDSLAYEVEVDRACYETFMMKEQLEYCVDELAVGNNPFITILNSQDECDHYSSIYLEDVKLLIKNDGFNIVITHSDHFNAF